VWIDDVQITEVAPANRGLVINGGFELGIAPWFSHQQDGGWRQIHSLSCDTPFGNHCLEITGDEESVSNRLIILNQALPSVENGVPYKLSLQFRSKVKEEPGPTKTVYLRVQQLGPKGEYILGNELHFPLDHDLWTYRELTFIPDKRTAKTFIYILSGNLKSSDKFYIDEVSVHKAVAPGTPFDPEKKSQAGSVSEISGDCGIAKINDAMWSELFLSNREALLEQMDTFMDRFSAMRDALAVGDSDTMRDMMRTSTERRRAFDKNS
jgi:hypothetical protein